MSIWNALNCQGYDCLCSDHLLFAGYGYIHEDIRNTSLANAITSNIEYATKYIFPCLLQSEKNTRDIIEFLEVLTFG